MLKINCPYCGKVTYNDFECDDCLEIDNPESEDSDIN